MQEVVGYVPVRHGKLYYREVGEGLPLFVLHGGPDFDQNYLLPELDRLADSFRLIYYDQCGRGKSATGVMPEDVSMESEVEDLEELRKYFGLETAGLLGHSWGVLLSLEYALKYPERVARLILMNPAPVSHADLEFFIEERRKRTPEDLAERRVIGATAAYQEGDPEAVADFYRVHYRATIRDRAQLERLIQKLTVGYSNEMILQARAIEDRLDEDTWAKEDYNLLPELKRLDIPTLVVHGDYDFVPVECSQHIAEAIPGARLVVLRDCGHFSYLECPEQVREEIGKFISGKT